MVLKHLKKQEDNESSPSQSNAARPMLAVFKALMSQSNGAQIGLIMQAVLDRLDNTNDWEKGDHCRWLIQAGVEWALYQHRYAVPTRLVERFLGTPDSVSQSIRTTLTSMVITAFTPPTSPVHTSMTDVISNLIGLVVQKSVVNPDDSLAPALVESISLLGTRVHHPNQLRDLAGELINQLVTIKTRIELKVHGGGRTQAIRSLLAGLCGLVQATGVQSAKHTDEVDAPKISDIPMAPTDQEDEAGRDRQWARPPWRTTISPEVWQDTLTLLCDGDYAVRADYAQALVSYINFGIPKAGDHTGLDGTKHGMSLVKQPKATTTVTRGDSVTMLLNVLHAYVYSLATTTSLGTGTAVSPSPSRRQRHLSRHPAEFQSKKLSSANLSDYGRILDILVAAHENLSVEALLTGIPMLLSLDNASKEYRRVEQLRYSALQEVLVRVWLKIGKVWNCTPVIAGAEKVRYPLPSPGESQSDCPAPGFNRLLLFTPLVGTGYREAWGLTPSAGCTGI